MKFLPALVILFVACTAENTTPVLPVTDLFDPGKATLLKAGDLTGINHQVSGRVAVYEDPAGLVVLLDPYQSQAGPDLKVYLSKDADATSYVRLGQLRSTQGKQSYRVTVPVNLADYPYVHIWCEQFNVVFGIASLQ
jgi:hypothetical protein